MSSTQFEVSEQGTIYNEIYCQTSRCMAWEKTKITKKEARWFPTSEVSWNDEECEYQDKTKEWGNDEKDTAKNGKEILLYKTVYLKHKDCSGYCKRLGNSENNF